MLLCTLMIKVLFPGTRVRSGTVATATDEPLTEISKLASPMASVSGDEFGTKTVPFEFAPFGRLSLSWRKKVSMLRPDREFKPDRKC